MDPPPLQIPPSPPPPRREVIGPFQIPMNRENVTPDVVGQRRVDDIISVLPQQRCGAPAGAGLEARWLVLDRGPGRARFHQGKNETLTKESNCKPCQPQYLV